MANYNTVDIESLQGNMQAEPRVFAHHAKVVDISSLTESGESIGVIDFTAPPNPPVDGDTISVLKRGACIYVGTGGNIKVKMESKAIVTFYNVADGSFLPIQVLRVYGPNGTDPNGDQQTDGTTADNILALF